jgi:hypothetical protein
MRDGSHLDGAMEVLLSGGAAATPIDPLVAETIDCCFHAQQHFWPKIV